MMDSTSCTGILVCTRRLEVPFSWLNISAGALKFTVHVCSVANCPARPARGVYYHREADKADINASPDDEKSQPRC